MNKEVEILKIGSILPVPAIGPRIYDTSQFRKKTILVVYNGGPVFDYYVNKLRDNCSDKYSFQKTDKSIVGKPVSFKRINSQDSIRGISDGEPVIGQSYTINNSSWYTSVVEKIIDNCILITKNSVYAIHNISDLRDKKINQLGL